MIFRQKHRYLSMYMMRRIAILYTLLIFISGSVFAQSDFCGIKNTSFQEGEKLSFKVYYNMGALWVGAGEASFTTTLEQMNNKRVYHVIGDGKTLKSYEWFYK